MAANQGVVAAQTILGDCYFFGTGVERNYKSAVN
jgi:TPR repeat protein